MSIYRWTLDIPSRSGWYWFRGEAGETEPFIVLVDGAGQFQWPDGDSKKCRWHMVNGLVRLRSRKSRMSIGQCSCAVQSGLPAEYRLYSLRGGIARRRIRRLIISTATEKAMAK